MWKNGLFTMWFIDFVTVFDQSYNCQKSHYLGRNQVFRPFLIFICYNSLEGPHSSKENYNSSRLLFEQQPSQMLTWHANIRVSELEMCHQTRKGCMHSKSIGQYVLSDPSLVVHLFSWTAPCSKQHIQLAHTARHSKQVYHYRRVAKSILLYSLYWGFS